MDSSGRRGAGRSRGGAREHPDGRGAPSPAGPRIAYTPAVPDGADCPWTRQRRTRWWLVVPSDAVGAGLVALFGAAASRTPGVVGTALWQSVVSVAVGWLVAWLIRRSRTDHLEMAAPDGLIVVAAAWAVWIGLRLVRGAGAQGADGGPAVQSLASWSVMTGAFLLAFLGGWRWLYGYVRAHDSLVPGPLARRMAAQQDQQE